jgi:hypothetical protein
MWRPFVPASMGSSSRTDGSASRIRSGKIITGDAAKALIERELAAHTNGIVSLLSRYQLTDTVHKWHATIRAVEEFINVSRFGIEDDQLRGWLLALPLDGRFLANPGLVLLQVQQALAPHFEVGTVQRFTQILLQTAAVAHAFRLHGQVTFGHGASLTTVGAAIDYFQSRRRHLVSLLYTMPYACRGPEQLAPLDTLNVLLPQVEHSCATITGLHQQLALADVLADFSLKVDDTGAVASHQFQTLERDFLEPERASIHAMSRLRGDEIILPDMEPVDRRKIFSAAELRNSVKLLGATYDAFGLNDSDFSTVALMVVAFSRHCRDDYVIVIPKTRFNTALRAQQQIDPSELRRLLVNEPSGYATNTNAFEPFIDLGDVVLSNVNLLSRFLYAFKNVHLGSRRRFQIHAGFIFEHLVKHDLAEMGFRVTNIKRINRKEFDVVAVAGDVIYNFQCKNNWIDLSKVEADRPLFVRYNRSLTNYYTRALAKEITSARLSTMSSADFR